MTFKRFLKLAVLGEKALALWQYFEMYFNFL